ncbi:hypothetical protein HDU83_001276 [Entophlyctis luteolus]|nr:hypothetical protein HDU83_001276 [Entophlyctis luteolus]
MAERRPSALLATSNLSATPDIENLDRYDPPQRERVSSIDFKKTVEVLRGSSTSLNKAAPGHRRIVREDHQTKSSYNSVLARSSKAKVGSTFVMGECEEFESKKIVRNGIVRFKGTKAFQFTQRALSSVKTQIHAYAIFNGLLNVVVSFIVVFIKGFALPSIKYYNFIHALLGAIGKMALISGFGLAQLISKEYVANSLINTPDGIPLSVITVPPSSFNPKEGHIVRKLFLSSLFWVEISIWYLLLQMKWTAIVTSIGTFPCSPARYSTSHSLPTVPEIASFLYEEATFAIIYNYGLPLSDGLVGGWSSWPLAAPSSAFHVENPGVVYAAKVDCENPTVESNITKLSQNQPPSVKTLSRSVNQTTGVFSSVLSLTYFAQTHNWALHLNDSIQQQCVAKLIMANGLVQMGFEIDEWQVMTEGTIDQITIQTDGGGNPLTITSDSQYSFDDVFQNLGVTNTNFPLLVWFTQIFDLIVGTGVESADGQAELFEWTKSGEIYDVQQSWRAISALFGSMSHYVLMQFDHNQTSECQFQGSGDTGIISMPSEASWIIMSAAITSLILNIWQFIEWHRNSGGGPLNERASVVLTSPLLLLFYMRQHIATLIGDASNKDFQKSTLQEHFAHIKVKMGESNKSKADAEGQIVIDEPKNVIPLLSNRQYVGGME